jgi:hypothetical protein
MISPWLLERVACPVCLERTGCAECRARGRGHEACRRTIAAARLPCGGPDKVRLSPRTAACAAVLRALYPVDADAATWTSSPRGPSAR